MYYFQMLITLRTAQNAFSTVATSVQTGAFVAEKVGHVLFLFKLIGAVRLCDKSTGLS
jgi:hypothetical protein